jgi:FtsP/CotA-like multicopper oxidase with cupredoxin domain
VGDYILMTTSSGLSRIAWFLVLWGACAFSTCWGEVQPPIVANQNHASAGVLRDGVLTVQLEIAMGDWHPEAEDGMSLSVYAFGETGRPLQNPGPLLRVPQGTEIRASVHNAIAVPVAVHGLGDGSNAAVVQVASHATEQIRFKATTPGLYFYWGASEGEDLLTRHGVDAELSGALVVDPPNADAKDEIFVMEMISDRAGPGSRETLATINGKSWPYTQRFEYERGNPVRWRWINATNEPHALHLHGFYYRIDAFNRGGHVETYEGDLRPTVVTQRISQGETFDMSWSPSRSGRWLFHCHMLVHMNAPIVPKQLGLVATADSTHTGGHDAMGMGQLVLGITVPNADRNGVGDTWRAKRKLQLEVAERDTAPRCSLQLRDTNEKTGSTTKGGLIGPPIVLTRDEPVEIEVVNKLSTPTAIHWHGIELESYYDGVPGWTGGPQTTPAIDPGSSFVARMTPPRAGTFIYHTHWHDGSQLTNGLYGPLIILPPGEKYDPASDLTFVFSLGDFGALREVALINGSPQSKSMQLQAGKKYRFRFINISPNNQGMQVSLRDAGAPVDWRVIAKDGADLPTSLQRSAKAQVTITVGETFDVEFTVAREQELLLDLLLPAQKIHVNQTLLFRPQNKRSEN